MKTVTALKIAANVADKQARPVGAKHARIVKKQAQRAAVKVTHGAMLAVDYARGFFSTLIAK